MTTAPLSPTPRSSPRRHDERAADDPAELRSLLDEALICHLGLQVDGAPRVLPTGYGRIDDQLYIHASSGARGLREAAGRVEICVTITLLDGIVYSRAAADHSMNYRSAMLHGPARPVTDPDEKWQALRALTEHLAPGSWEYTRKPNKRELAKTSVIAVTLDEAAVKIRMGGPSDEDADVANSDTWAGVLPLRWSWGEPEPCVQLDADAEIPRHVRHRMGR